MRFSNSVDASITALSTLLNALLLGRRYETLSARCWRCRSNWFFCGLRKAIDTLFFWQSGHCESIYRLEVELGIQGYGDRMVKCLMMFSLEYDLFPQNKN